MVALAAGLVVLLVVNLDLIVFGDVTLFTDIVFVLVCASAALAVRPRDFFVVGVCPPLLMAGAFTVLAVLHRDALAEPTDGFFQALVSALAHHAGSLVVGYALTLTLLALRQVAGRHGGALRAGVRPSSATAPPPSRHEPREVSATAHR